MEIIVTATLVTIFGLGTILIALLCYRENKEVSSAIQKELEAQATKQLEDKKFDVLSSETKNKLISFFVILGKKIRPEDRYRLTIDFDREDEDIINILLYTNEKYLGFSYYVPTNSLAVIVSVITLEKSQLHFRELKGSDVQWLYKANKRLTEEA